MPHTRYQSAFDVSEGEDLLLPDAPMLAPEMAPTPQAPLSMPGAPQLPTPSFGPTLQPPQESTGRKIALLIPALLAGLKDPASIGAAMRGISKARDRKMAAYENELQRQERKSREAAEFWARAMESANGIADEAEFERWRQMVSPSADLHGIDPGLFTFNKSKATETKRKGLVAQLDAMEKRDPSLLQRDDFSVSSPDYGEPVHVSIVRGWRAEPVDAKGARIVPPQSDPFTATTPDKLKIEAKARALGVPVNQLTPEQIAEAVNAGKPASTATPGSFEEYLAAPPERRAEIEAARKGYMQADDKTASVNTGAQDQRRFSMEQRLLAQWDKANTPMREMRRQHGLMQTGLKRFRAGDTNGGSQAVLVTFQKILDPTSVVRESEYARTATGQSLLNRIEGYTQRLAAGGAGMTDGELSAMVQTAQEFLDGMATHTAGLRERIERTAGEYQLDPRLIFDDVAEPALPTATPTGGSRIKSATRVK